MQLCSIPLSSGTNPYLGMLNTALAERGVEFLPPSKSLNDIAAHVSDGVIIHFHWPSRLYARVTRIEMEEAVQEFLDLLNYVRHRGGRIIWTVHNLMPHEVLHPDLEMIARTSLVQNCSAIIAHCQRAACEVVSLFGANPPVHIIPHPDLSSAYPELVPKRVARHILGLSDDQFVFLVFGSLRPYKGIELALAAFERLRASRARLLVVGEPSECFDVDWLRAAAIRDSRIILNLNSASKECVAEFYGAADVSLHCYKAILTSGSVALAMGMSTAVIAPRIGCLEEMICPGAGILYEPGDVIGLVRALTIAMNEDVEQQGAFGKRQISSWPVSFVAEQILCVYMSVLTSGRL